MEKKSNKKSLNVYTNSEVQTLRSCPELHGFKYERKLSPPLRPMPLAFGGAFHDGVAAALTTIAADYPEHDTERSARSAAESAINQALTRWDTERTILDESLSADEIEDQSKTNVELASFLAGRFIRVAIDDASHLELVAVEMPFDVRVRLPGGRRSSNHLSGVIDALWYDRELHAFVIDEHKTTAGDPYGVERRLFIDPQTTGYAYAVREMLIDGDSRLKATYRGREIPEGASVGQVRFNVVRKKLPREPHINKDGTVSAAAIDTTEDIYRDALNAQVRDRGIPVNEKQQARLDLLAMKGETYFARFVVYRSESELERWAMEFQADAKRIRAMRRHPQKRTRNPGHCTAPWSPRCPFSDLCAEPNAPEIQAMFVTREDRHTEVIEAEREQEQDGDNFF